MKKIFVLPVLVLVFSFSFFTAGCTATGSEKSVDPLVGTWEGIMITDLLVTMDVYSNGTAFFSADTFMNGKLHPLTWEKNPNGSYTLNGNRDSRLLTITGDTITLQPPLNVTLTRTSYTPKGKIPHVFENNAQL